LMHNFNHPYIATSPADFWRRWHISLSSWLRDFIYIPLGGNRGGPARASFHLIATFAITGLWHGASWNYVLWGLYWGFLILVQRFLGWLGVTKWFPWIAKVAMTFGVTCVSWLLFRERNLGKLLHDFSQSPFATATEQWWVGAYLITLVFIYAAPLIIHLVATSDFARRRFAITWPNLGLLGEAGVAALLLLGIVLARSITTSDFIYFQF